MVPWDEVYSCVSCRDTFLVKEKAKTNEAAMKCSLAELGVDRPIDLPNKYDILGRDQTPLFHAIETTSVIDQSLGWLYSADIMYTERGRCTPFLKLRGDAIEASAADFWSEETQVLFWQESEEWCCCCRPMTQVCPCCHASFCDRCHGSCVGGCCAGCFTSCCCCWSREIFYASEIRPGEMRSQAVVHAEAYMHRDHRPRPTMALQQDQWFYLPWVCGGCCGGGSAWTILRNPRRYHNNWPPITYHGERIGEVKQKGRGCLGAWCCKRRPKDPWFVRARGMPKDKLFALAMIIFMDHSNGDHHHYTD